MTQIPDAKMAPRFRSPISLIWIVPLLAVFIGVGLAVHAVLQRGPEIELQFASAEGLDANKTRLKYKDVAIGTVTAIALAEDRHSVRVAVQIDKQAAPLLVEDSRFWVVRPRFAAGGVSGLNTVLSGAYIALDPGKSESAQRRFVGLESPPLVVGDMPGGSLSSPSHPHGDADPPRGARRPSRARLAGAPGRVRRVSRRPAREVRLSLHRPHRHLELRR